MPRSRTIVVLNGSEERLQIVLGESNKQDQAGDHGLVLYAKEMRVPGHGMQHLAPALAEALACVGSEPSALSGIACVRGPGSFTGLRLIMATALGLSVSTGVPLAGLDYLPLLAAAPVECASGTIHVLVHARAKLVYLQSFRTGESTVPGTSMGVSIGAPLSETRVASLEEVVETVGRTASPAYLLGSGLRRNLGFFEIALARLPQTTFLSPVWDAPRPETLLHAALAARYAHAPLEPLYLRPSDAEENLPDFAALRGVPPEEAREWLDQARLSVTSMVCTTPGETLPG